MTYRSDQVGQEGNEEKDEPIPEDQLDELRVLRPFPRQSEFHAREHQDRKVKAHGINERRSKECVVGISDDTANTGNPDCLEQDTFIA